MALSITATAQPLTASVLLEVTATGTVAEVIRTDGNGMAPVRTLAGDLPDTGTIILSDYEAALVGLITYTVTDGTDTETASVTLAADLPWLFVPVVPNYSAQVEMVTGYTAERGSLSTIHDVVGRPDPVVTVGRLGYRRGTLEVWCATYEAAADVVGVYERGQVVMLRQATFAGLDMYHTPTSLAVEPYPDETGTRRWRVSVQYVEVTRPTAALAGSLGWSFADVAAGWATFSTLAAAFEDFDALTVGA